MKTKECKNCSEKFIVTHGNARFCSKNCFKAFYHQYRKNWKTNNTVVEKTYTKSGHRAYNNIQQRCENPNHPSFHNYGARGIKLELNREEFEKIYFNSEICENCGIKLNDNDRNAKDGRTLDRIDQADNYRKGNLRILCRSCNASFAFKRRKGKN